MWKYIYSHIFYLISITCRRVDSLYEVIMHKKLLFLFITIFLSYAINFGVFKVQITKSHQFCHYYLHYLYLSQQLVHGIGYRQSWNSCDRVQRRCATRYLKRLVYHLVLIMWWTSGLSVDRNVAVTVTVWCCVFLLYSLSKRNDDY